MLWDEFCFATTQPLPDAELEKLQAEAAELLEASQRNAADTSSVMQISTRFADNVMVILDKKALDEELGIDTDNAGAQYADLDI